MSLPANIHILGIQGSGKGTQSALLVERYKFLYLASGNLFRARAEKGDELARKIGAEMKAGRLLPDAYLYHTVIDTLHEQPYPSGILGDGVIRTIGQFNHLNPVWEMNGLDKPLLINLVLDEAHALERIKHREEVIASGNAELHKSFTGKLAHRADDNPQAIEERFQLFHTMTEPVIALFKDQGRCIEVDARVSIENIFSTICSGIEQYYPNTHVTH